MLKALRERWKTELDLFIYSNQQEHKLRYKYITVKILNSKVNKVNIDRHITKIYELSNFVS